MYDLHCHLLPGIDDGARDLAMALEMARMASLDGTTHLACTPHIYPGLFDNTAAGISSGVAALRRHLQDAGIALELAVGADIQMVPELPQGLRAGTHPTINGSRYLLFEPPHHLAPAYFAESLYQVRMAGYVPIITHPERLGWIDEHYPDFVQAVEQGAWLQITAGALTGRFGKGPRYWSERLLDEGLVHLIASDGHNLSSRPPLLTEGRDAAIPRVGEAEATRLVSERPRAVWNNLDPQSLTPPPGRQDRRRRSSGKGWFGRLFGG